MLRSFGLLFLAGILITLSMFDCSRISEPGVVSQEVCSDIPVGDPRRADCVNPEDTDMWRGSPNGTGWILFFVGLGVLAFAVVQFVKAAKSRERRKLEVSSTERHR